MRFCRQLDLSAPNGCTVDRVISLQFPGYAAHHPHHIVWLMHQHRAVYELFDPARADADLAALRTEITAFDNHALARVRYRFASPRCAERLLHYNGLSAEPLMHPPALAEHFYNAEAQPYIYYPSRLETLKRQELLIEAARHLRSPVKIIFSGEGGQSGHYHKLLRNYQLQSRIRFLGHISEAHKLAFYAHALAVFFGPLDEDYGYITLEAMLAAKPVITCTDSGGPLAFIEHGDTGFIEAPDPRAIAARIDALYANRSRARQIGRNARAHYHSLALSWHHVAELLTNA